MGTKLRDDAADGFGRGDWEDGAAPAVSPRNYNHGTGADERPAGRSNDPNENYGDGGSSNQPTSGRRRAFPCERTILG
jgi:hypothetical protein